MALFSELSREQRPNSLICLSKDILKYKQYLEHRPRKYSYSSACLVEHMIFNDSIGNQHDQDSYNVIDAPNA